MMKGRAQDAYAGHVDRFPDRYLVHVKPEKRINAQGLKTLQQAAGNLRP